MTAMTLEAMWAPACATCHVHVRDGGASLAKAGADDNKNDQLDNAWRLETQCRPPCCIKLVKADITAELPKHTRYHVRAHGDHWLDSL